MNASPVGHKSGAVTILLVDDTDEFRQLIRTFLAEGGYKVLEAQNSSDAIEIFERHSGPIHLLITDTEMPGMTGPQLVEYVTSRHPRTRVLCMSGEPRDTALMTTVPFLQKPFDRKALLREVQRILIREKPHNAP